MQIHFMEKHEKNQWFNLEIMLSLKLKLICIYVNILLIIIVYQMSNVSTILGDQLARWSFFQKAIYEA